MGSIFTYIMMVLVYLLWFFPKWKNDRLFLVKTIFYIYICMILEVTILPVNFSAGLHLPQRGILEYGNFEPFVDLLKGRPLAKTEIFLNILMMIPFGILYPSSFNKSGLQTIFHTFVLSLTIESLQLFMAAFMSGSRTFDVTDLITNTIGGFIGFVIFMLGVYFVKHKDKYL